MAAAALCSEVRMPRAKEPTQLELELRMQHAVRPDAAGPRPSPDDADAPDPAEVTDDETSLPSSDEEEFEHEDIWSDPDI
jgi:hypothetical protein